MTSTLYFLAYAAALTWLTLVFASLLRVKAWTPQGIRLACGNRNNLPEPSPLAGRAERCASNTLENFVLFAALVLTAHIAMAGNQQVELGAKIFFWARIAYIPVYLAGITYLRTGIWAVGVFGLSMIFVALV